MTADSILWLRSLLFNVGWYAGSAVIAIVGCPILLLPRRAVVHQQQGMVGLELHELLDRPAGDVDDGPRRIRLEERAREVELGADVLKADPTDDVSRYHKVIEAAGGVPVLVRGGGKVGAG